MTPDPLVLAAGMARLRFRPLSWGVNRIDDRKLEFPAPPRNLVYRLPAMILHALSRRLPWEHPKNRLTLAVEERAARGLETIDLTETNPTRVGLAYPAEELAE